MAVDRIVPSTVAVLCALALALWLFGGESSGLQERLPPPKPKAAPVKPPEPIAKTCRLETSDGVPADLPGAWPSFRGAQFDAVASDQPELARAWPEAGPDRLWAVDVGDGYSAAAVLNGRVYIMDYDQAALRDTLRCLSLADGKEIWRLSHPVKVKWNYGMSRTVPAVTETCAVGFGPLCHVICADAKTGAFKWAFDLAREFGAEVPPWYAGQCPLIDAGRAILAVGGESVLLMAVDCETGAIAWKTPNPRRWKMTHSSVMPMDFNGQRLYLYCTTGGIVAVSAKDGRVLWEDRTWQAQPAHVPSPVIIGGGRVFLTAGYGAGSRLIQFRNESDKLAAETVFQVKEHVFAAEQHTPIFYEGHIYGVNVKGELACLDLAGVPLWSSGRLKKFNRGPYLIASGLIYIMNDLGVLTLVEATPSGYRQLAEAKVLPSKDKESWAPMALVAGRLILRDMKQMICLDVRRK